VTNNRTRTRELVEDDIASLYQHFAAASIGIVNEGRECHSQLALVKMDDAEPGKLAHLGFIEPEVVNMLQQSSTTKDFLMLLISELLKGDKISPSAPFVPDAIVHVSEIWVVQRKGRIPADLREAERQLGCECDDLSEHPDRTEALVIAVHTKDRSFMGICPITGQGSERRAEFKPLHKGPTVGRMTMHQDDPTHGPH